MRVFKGVGAKNWLLDTLLDNFSMLGISFSVAGRNDSLSDRVTLCVDDDCVVAMWNANQCILTLKLVSAPLTLLTFHTDFLLWFLNNF